MQDVPRFQCFMSNHHRRLYNDMLETGCALSIVCNQVPYGYGALCAVFHTFLHQSWLHTSYTFNLYIGQVNKCQYHSPVVSWKRKSWFTSRRFLQDIPMQTSHKRWIFHGQVCLPKGMKLRWPTSSFAAPTWQRGLLLLVYMEGKQDSLKRFCTAHAKVQLLCLWFHATVLVFNALLELLAG